MKERYIAQRERGTAYGVWDALLHIFVTSEFGEFTSLTEADAEFMADQLNRETSER
jgi:hypothetical protein